MNYFKQSILSKVILISFIVSCGESDLERTVRLQKEERKIIANNMKSIISSFDFNDLNKKNISDEEITKQRNKQKRKIISFNLQDDYSIKYNGVIDSYLPDSLKAFNKDELTTIVLRSYKRIHAGQYTNGAGAFSAEIKIYFINYPSNEIYKIIDINNPPEQTIRRRRGSNTPGNTTATMQESIDYILDYY